MPRSPLINNLFIPFELRLCCHSPTPHQNRASREYVSLARVMGPPRCHEHGTTRRCHRASTSPSELSMAPRPGRVRCRWDGPSMTRVCAEEVSRSIADCEQGIGGHRQPPRPPAPKSTPVGVRSRTLPTRSKAPGQLTAISWNARHREAHRADFIERIADGMNRPGRCPRPIRSRLTAM